MHRVLVVAIMLLAMNLRAPILGITPLLQFIRVDYGLSNSVVSLLTALPLLIFALFSSFSADWSKRFGIGRVLVVSLLCIALGELTRLLGGEIGLFIGTLIIALGIVSGNVLIPALIRGFFPHHMGIMTSSYSSIMQVTTTVVLLSAVPISVYWGWANTLALLLVVSIAALLVWMPFRKLTLENTSHTKEYIDDTKEDINTTNTVSDIQVEHSSITLKQMYSQSLAWYITLFMGIQSILFYSISTWLPTIVVSKGFTPTWGGYMGFIFQLVSLVIGFIAPVVMHHFKDQRSMAVAACLAYGLGMVGLFTITDVNLLIVSIFIMGAGAGSTFSIALMYFVLRTETAFTSAKLSGTGQAIGYLLASVGPLCLGYIYDVTQSWWGAMIVLVILCIIFGYCGYMAGFDRRIKER